MRNRFLTALTYVLLAGSQSASLAAQATAEPDSLPADSTMFELAPVVVTATRTNATISDLAVSVNVVGRAEVRDQPNRLLLDALIGEPGVLIQQTTAGQGAAFVRALTGSQVLLMVDGVRLNNGTFRQGPSQYLASVDPETVERIEVIRGAASALYGSDAIGGVINVITRRAADLIEEGRRGALEGNYTFDGATRGSRARLSGAMAFPRVLDGLEIFGGGSFVNQGDLRPGGGLPRQAPTGFDHWGVDLRVDLQASSTTRYDFSLQRFEQQSVPRYDRLVDFRAPGLDLGGVGRNSLYVFDPQDRTLARFRANWILQRRWLTHLDVSLAYQKQNEGRTTRRQSLVDGIITPSSTTRFVFDGVRSLSLDVQGQALSRDGGRIVTYGAEAWDNQTDSEGWSEDASTGIRTPEFRISGTEQLATGRFPDDSRYRGAAVYGFLDQELSDGVRLQVGARGSAYWADTRVGDAFGGDVNSRSTDVSAEAGLVWAVSPVLSVRGRAAQAFRAPNIYDLTLVGDVPGGMALPSPNLGPETSLTIEAGASLTPSWGSLDVTVFRMTIDGLMDRVLGTFEGDSLFGPDRLRVLTIQNVGEARLRGLEVGLTTRLPGGGRLQAATYWTRGDATVARDDGFLAQQEPLSRVPPLTLSSKFRWPFEVAERTGWLEYFLMAAGRQDRLGFRDELDSRIQPGGTQSYLIQSIRVGLEVSSALRLAVGAENLFDELYRIHGSGIDAPGRHVYARLDVRW